MQSFPAQTGLLQLFTAEGGPGQQKWYNIRINYKSAGSGDAYLYILRGTQDVWQVDLSLSANEQNFSTHVLMTTGDVLYLDAGEFTVDFIISANVDTEEF